MGEVVRGLESKKPFRIDRENVPEGEGEFGVNRALPGDDRSVPDDGLVPGRAPRRRLLRPVLPAGGAARTRALPFARLARSVGVPADAVFELG